MSHPQPPFGPQDPNQQPPEPPTQPFPTAPMPPVPDNPYAPPPAPDSPWAQQPPVSGAPQPPVSGAPQPPMPGAPYPPPTAPQPPTTPFPPVAGTPQPPYPPTSGTPYPPQPPSSGTPYPPAGAYPAGGAYPPAPGQPFGAPPAKQSNKNVWIIVGIIAAVLLLLCCGGGIFAIYSGAKKAQDAVESLPTPAVSYDAPTRGAEPTPEAGQTDGETFNMKPGDTLIINDDDGTVEITVSNFRTKDKACQTYMPGPKNGMYLIADVTAEVTKGTGSINPFYFKWIGADGSEANGVAGALSGCGKLLGSGNDLASGSKRTGQLVFDVKDKNGTLEYEHRLETAGSWKP
ncbi:DUF4352 domain-containing protein [Micromonospora sp. NPDC007230]|uniref:DUF4352 domain-containing protein n=1 Tax=Micromonospora sp. NPDC007230 TaxID=3364237 RepID=UPI00367AD78A